MKKINVLKLIVSLLIPLIAGFIGSLFTNASISSWYVTLAKPEFNPPNWIFAPVWTLLYLLMGLALYLIWNNKLNKKVKTALIFFDCQLLLNVLWSVLFFGLRNPLLAFIEIVILWILILITTYKFYQINRTAGYLFMPYLLWVTFAAFLNIYILILN